MEKIDIKNSLYPKLLKEIPNAPLYLYYRGVLKNESPKIAIIGTRKATHEGKNIAKTIAKELSEAGLTIVSGLALGIDSAAHEGALIHQGKTIAVLGNGLNEIYPKTNENLARKIIESGGAIISEYEPDCPALPHQFLARNRIVSGMCLGIVIIECPISSGALNTAKHALEQGREVFVFPGPVNHPNYRGSHLLIRNGARLVTSAKDILEDLNIAPKTNQNLFENNLDDVSKNILMELKNHKTLTIDNLSEAIKIEPYIISQKISLLEIQGIIEIKGSKIKLR